MRSGLTKAYIWSTIGRKLFLKGIFLPSGTANIFLLYQKLKVPFLCQIILHK